MANAKSKALDRKKFFGDPILVIAILVIMLFLLLFIEIILTVGLDICCAKLSEQMHHRNSICPCRFVISSCFS